MRDGTSRSPDKLELSLDGRQIASVVVGALVILGVVFVLGLNVGRQVAVRQAEAARAPSLEALDRAPLASGESAVPASSLTFHDSLTKERPPAQPPVSAPVVIPAATPETLAAARPTAPVAEPARSPEPANSPEPAASGGSAQGRPRAVTPAPSRTSPAGAFTIQLGAVRDHAEAERLAARFRSYSPRIEAAEIAGTGKVFRVRVGSFETRDAAARSLSDVSRETGAKGWVTASR